MPHNPTNKKYEIARLAEVIAEMTSGVQGAISEQADHELAVLIHCIIEEHLEKDDA